MSFLKKIFGNTAPEPVIVARTAAPSKQARTAESQSPTPPEDSEAFLFREEVLDARNRLCGYRFTPMEITGSVVPEPLFFKALEDARIVQFAERRRAFIPMGIDAVVFNRHAALVAPNAFFIIDEREVSGDHAKLEGRLSAIRGAGGRTGVSGFTAEMSAAGFLATTDLVIFSMGDPAFSRVPDAISTLRSTHPAIEIAIEGVNSWAERRLCAAWSVDYCLGAFLSSIDENEKEGVLDQSRLTAMEMLNLLRRDADLSELADVAKRDPGATFRLLNWANSSAMGRSTTINSLQQAMVVLGREQLCRWLMVSMFRRGQNRERDESLLEVALTRARFLEQVTAPGLSGAQRDELFLVGLMSVFDVLLSMPMSKVLSHMNLSTAVQDVLLRSEGPYARFLMLALTLERGSAEQIGRRVAAMGIDVHSLEDSRRSAFEWAQQALTGPLAG
jgi:EAL and modified HD-GYP domain-containing signal transduction protein